LKTEAAFDSHLPLQGFNLHFLKRIQNPIISLLEKTYWHVVPIFVGTGNVTCSATYAFILIYHDDTIIPFVGSSCRTNFHARGLTAMIAQYWSIGPFDIRVFSYLICQGLCKKDALRRTVLLLAGNRAGIAANASL